MPMPIAMPLPLLYTTLRYFVGTCPKAFHVKTCLYEYLKGEPASPLNLRQTDRQTGRHPLSDATHPSALELFYDSFYMRCAAQRWIQPFLLDLLTECPVNIIDSW